MPARGGLDREDCGVGILDEDTVLKVRVRRMHGRLCAAGVEVPSKSFRVHVAAVAGGRLNVMSVPFATWWMAERFSPYRWRCVSWLM